MTTDQMMIALHSSDLDVATVAAMPRFDDGRLASHPLGREPLVLEMSPQNPLAGLTNVPVAALEGLDLVSFPQGSTAWEIIVSILVAAGISPRFRFETSDLSMARSLASADLAVAILPQSVAQEPGQPIWVAHLEPEPTWSPSMAWLSGRKPAPALDAFLRFVVDHGDPTDANTNGDN